MNYSFLFNYFVVKLCIIIFYAWVYFVWLKGQHISTIHGLQQLYGYLLLTDTLKQNEYEI